MVVCRMMESVFISLRGETRREPRSEPELYLFFWLIGFGNVANPADYGLGNRAATVLYALNFRCASFPQNTKKLQFLLAQFLRC